MMKPELFLIGFLDEELEKQYGKSMLYVVTAADYCMEKKTEKQ